MDASYSIGSFHTHRANLNAQFMEQHTGLVVRPAIGISYSKNDYRMKDVQMRNETGDQFIYGNPKRFHDGYFSLLAQIEAGITGKFWADEFRFRFLLQNRQGTADRIHTNQSLWYG